MIQFNDTKIAFVSHSTADLKKAKILFRAMGSSSVVKVGKVLLNFALAIRFPISWIVKPTIFKHFVGGETLEESNATVDYLAKYNVKSVLDYSVEGAGDPASHESAYNEIMRSIENAEGNPNILFTVFKPTGLVSHSVLEKVSQGETMTDEEAKEFALFETRVKNLCQRSVDLHVPILVDAEDTWYQKALDDVVNRMMETYNKEEVWVYNTLQMYRTDRVDFLDACIKEAREKGYKLGIKFVRGAYMEKERERAKQMGYPSPINPDKPATDKMYDDGQELAFKNLDIVSIFCGTHNELSTQKLCQLMVDAGIEKNDKRIAFSQLIGMSDNISFMLAHEGFNVVKYVPYGPVRKVMPYLIRRAEENTSVKGQTGRELSMIQAELKRRKLAKNE